MKLTSRAVLRPHFRSVKLCRTRRMLHAGPPPPPTPKGIPFTRILGLAAIGIAGAGSVVAYPYLVKKDDIPTGPRLAEIEFEKPRKQPASKEENREIVSSQHVQVKKSWENPGVYAWGSNTGKVVAPESNEAVVKTPRRIPYFDGQILRDLKLDRNFGAAVTENGDLVQWGTGFSKDDPNPAVTLSGKDLVKVSLSKDRVIALSSGGSVFSIPVSRADQVSGEKETSSSWFPFWSNSASVSYRTLKPVLAWGEKVTDIKSGLEHCLLLTSKGRVFSAASSSEDYPTKGQLGVAGLTWANRPNGPYDQPHEVPTLRGFDIKQIAAGDYHSMVLDEEGRVFGFGDNATGQLGIAPDLGSTSVDVPSLLPINQLYTGTGQSPRVTSIAAGGLNSFFTVDASKRPASAAAEPTSEITRAGDTSPVTADTWACGEGIHGSLGTGKWTHISESPTKIKALSNLREFDEKTQKVVPIRLSRLSVGSTHAAAVMDNATSVSVTARSSEHDTNYGADVLWWGGNEHYQLGTGKRNNVAAPMYIGPLDRVSKGEEQHRFQIAPRAMVSRQGRKAAVEQRVECGRFVSAVYSAA